MEMKTRRDKVEFIIIVAILVFIVAILIHGQINWDTGRYDFLAGG